MSLVVASTRSASGLYQVQGGLELDVQGSCMNRSEARRSAGRPYLVQFASQFRILHDLGLQHVEIAGPLRGDSSRVAHAVPHRGDVLYGSDGAFGLRLREAETIRGGSYAVGGDHDPAGDAADDGMPPVRVEAVLLGEPTRRHAANQGFGDARRVTQNDPEEKRGHARDGENRLSNQERAYHRVAGTGPQPHPGAGE